MVQSLQEKNSTMKRNIIQFFVFLFSLISLVVASKAEPIKPNIPGPCDLSLQGWSSYQQQIAQYMIDNQLVIHNFNSCIKASPSEAICLPVAISNGIQLMSYLQKRTFIETDKLYAATEELWNAIKNQGEVDAHDGTPEHMNIGLLMGMAYRFGLMEYQTPFFKNELSSSDISEVVPTASRLRILGIKTPKSGHVLLGVAFDFQSRSLLALDPNDPNRLQRYEIVQKKGKLYLKPMVSESNVISLHSRVNEGINEYEILSLTGLNYNPPPNKDR